MDILTGKTVTSSPHAGQAVSARPVLSRGIDKAPTQVSESIALTTENVQKLIDIVPKNSSLVLLLRAALSNSPSGLPTAHSESEVTTNIPKTKLHGRSVAAPAIQEPKLGTALKLENRSLPLFLLKINFFDSKGTNTYQWVLSKENMMKGQTIFLSNNKNQLTFTTLSKKDSETPTSFITDKNSGNHYVARKSPGNIFLTAQEKSLINAAKNEIGLAEERDFQFSKNTQKPIAIRNELIQIVQHKLFQEQKKNHLEKNNNHSNKADINTLKFALDIANRINKISSKPVIQIGKDGISASKISNFIRLSGLFLESTIKEALIGKEQEIVGENTKKDRKNELLSLLNTTKLLINNLTINKKNTLDPSLEKLISVLLAHTTGYRPTNKKDKVASSKEQLITELSKLELSIKRSLDKITNNQLQTLLLNESSTTHSFLTDLSFCHTEDRIPIAIHILAQNKKKTKTNKPSWKFVFDWRLKSHAFSCEITLEERRLKMKLWCDNADIRKKCKQNMKQLAERLDNQDIIVEEAKCVDLALRRLDHLTNIPGKIQKTLIDIET